uniref:Uncharacterized protein n=2 Tax=Avena sativa TaxID=4498 RepID=A0ACD5XVL6_AVESA
MEVAAGAMSPLLRKLGSLLVDEYGLENRVKKGIRSLETELTFMYSALREVGRVPPDQLEDQIYIWADKVRELSYEIEDAVDAFVVRVEEDGQGQGHDRAGPNNTKNRVKKFLKRATKLFTKGKDLHQISSAIDEAQILSKQLAELRERYKLDLLGVSVGASTIDPRLTAMYKDVSELVGIDGPCDKVIKMLTEGDEIVKKRFKIVSVVGFGGLGKTTLVKQVYERIKVQFDCSAFVSVSRNPDMKKVFKDMLYELNKVQFENIHIAATGEKQLIDKLRGFLKEKRYLIVIDDIWDEKSWEIIKCALYDNGLGSRLITTTRISSVSEACCSSTDDRIYRMNHLTDDDSKRLFHRRIFPHGKECPHELAQVSEDILKKCGGVPLAIITIASLLASNQQIKTKNEWYALLKSIGRGLAGGACVDDMQKILSFSYYDLPSHLKACLLYLSTFPEDCVIERDRLIWRWIAEGFVQDEKQDTSLYELAESYYNELINRSMIEAVGIDAEGRAETCRVHDMVLDLICSLSSAENFVSILDGIKRKKRNPQSKVRRLSFQNIMSGSTTPLLPNTDDMAQVRSVSVFSHGINQVPSLACFRVLRVLDLAYCDLREHDGHKINLSHVGNLLHLRYLGLRDTQVGELPREIGKLRILQTLDLEGTSLKEVSSSIIELGHLMCLYVNKNARLPVGLGSLSLLEELSEVRMDRYSPDTVKDFGHLSELRVLRINLGELDDSLDKAFVECMQDLHKLQSLDIDAKAGGCVDVLRAVRVPPPDLRRLVSSGEGGRFLTLPTWINSSSLPLLSYLDIWVDDVGQEDMNVLGMLPCLRSLFVGVWRQCVEDDAESLVLSADAFPCIRECVFFNLITEPSLPRGAMPRVEQVQLSFRARDIAAAGARESLDLLDMGHLAWLEQVRVDLRCKGASAVEVKEAEAALRLAVHAHPYRALTLHIRRR